VTVEPTGPGPAEPGVVAELRRLLVEVTGEDEGWAARVAKESRLEGDLRLESVEWAALADRLAERYGGRVDLAAYLADLDIHQIIGLTVGDLAGYIGSRLPAPSPPARTRRRAGRTAPDTGCCTGPLCRSSLVHAHETGACPVAGDSMIETSGLRKSFQVGKGRKGVTVEAVRGVDLSVAEGEIFGFLGPNGAGKTTTLRMLSTLLLPDGGEATIAGADLRTDPAGVRKRVGYVAQGGGTWDEVTAEEELVLQARMHGFSKAEAKRRAAALLGAFDLAGYADRRCKTYSGGQRRRVDIALGVIHSPKVLFLDEPTAGLDPQSRAHMWEEVRRLRAEGMTVFITTHYLEEADVLCDRIAIIDHGEIVAEGTPDALKREISGDVLAVTLNGSTSRAAELLSALPLVNKLEAVEEAGLWLYVDSGATAIPQVLRVLECSGVEMDAIELHRPSLDDVFLTKTGRSLRDK